MSPLKRRLLEDRAMRDAARGVVDRTVGFIREDVAQRSVPARLLDTGKDYARGVGDGALDVARDNRGALMGGLGLALAGAAAWFFRDEIAEVVAGLVEGTFDDDLSPEGDADAAGEDPAEPSGADQS